VLGRITPIIALLALTVSGCAGGDHAEPPLPTTGTTSTPRTTTTTSPATTTQTSRPTAPPPVTDPIDLRRFYNDPCAALTPSQQNEISFRPYQPVDHEASNREFSNCRWRQERGPKSQADYGYQLWLYWSGDPLADAYSKDNQANWEVFEPQRIRGLPAVVTSVGTVDEDCRVFVGTGHGQGIEIDGFTAARMPNLRDRLVTAAEWVLDAARK
jgi:Protein of unknown function (DUF3558)